ncbi:Globulin-1 S allele [Balamuthia mandrillaris]
MAERAVVFADAEFAASGWEAVVLSRAIRFQGEENRREWNLAPWDVFQEQTTRENSGGNPQGAFRQSKVVLPPPVETWEDGKPSKRYVTTAHLCSSATFDPRELGEVAAIDCSFDLLNVCPTTNNGEGRAAEEVKVKYALLAEQGGRFFCSPFATVPQEGGQWQGFVMTDLKAEHFHNVATPLLPSSAASATLEQPEGEFAFAGDRVRFGFLVRTTFTGVEGGVAITGIDNWKVVVMHKPAPHAAGQSNANTANQVQMLEEELAAQKQRCEELMQRLSLCASDDGTKSQQRTTTRPMQNKKEKEKEKETDGKKKQTNGGEENGFTSVVKAAQGKLTRMEEQRRKERIKWKKEMAVVSKELDEERKLSAELKQKLCNLEDQLLSASARAAEKEDQSQLAAEEVERLRGALSDASNAQAELEQKLKAALIQGDQMEAALSKEVEARAELGLLLKTRTEEAEFNRAQWKEEKAALEQQSEATVQDLSKRFEHEKEVALEELRQTLEQSKECELDKLRQELEGASARAEEAIRRVQQLKEVLEGLEANNAAHQLRIAELETSLYELNETRSQLEDNVKDLSAYAETLDVSLREEKKKNASLILELEDRALREDTLKQQLEKEKRSGEEAIIALKQELENKQKELDEVLSDRDSLQECNQHLEEQLKTIQNVVSKLEEEKDTLQHTISVLTEEERKLRKDNEAMVFISKQETREKQREIDVLKKLYEEEQQKAELLSQRWKKEAQQQKQEFLQKEGAFRKDLDDERAARRRLLEKVMEMEEQAVLEKEEHRRKLQQVEEDKRAALKMVEQMYEARIAALEERMKEEQKKREEEARKREEDMENERAGWEEEFEKERLARMKAEQALQELNEIFGKVGEEEENEWEFVEEEEGQKEGYDE